jgi:hypothetical protein
MTVIQARYLHVKFQSPHFLSLPPSLPSPPPPHCLLNSGPHACQAGQALYHLSHTSSVLIISESLCKFLILSRTTPRLKPVAKQ